MRGMGAGMRRARLGRERREWRCHPHLGEETRSERGRAERRGGARGTAGNHGTRQGRDTQGPPRIPRRLRPAARTHPPRLWSTDFPLSSGSPHTRVALSPSCPPTTSS